MLKVQTQVPGNWQPVTGNNPQSKIRNQRFNPQAPTSELENNLAYFIGKDNIAEGLDDFGERSDGIDNGLQLVALHKVQHVGKFLVVAHGGADQGQLVPKHAIQIDLR